MMAWPLLALLVSLLQVPPSSAQIRSAAFDVMKAARYCTLITNGSDGQPQARIVDPLIVESETAIYIATNPVTRKVGELQRDARVTLTFFNASQGEYVTVRGRAVVMTDAARKAAHWKAEWEPFYKEKTKGADFMLIEVTPSRLEISSQRLGMNNDPKTWQPVIVDMPPARAASGYGVVNFANSGAEAAQADFQAGIALLHDFEYEAAIEAFKRAQAIDPGFAMAYWGEAMSYTHQVWMEQDVPAARAALSRLAPTAAARRAKAASEREQSYFAAVEALYGDGTKIERDFAFESAMARVHAKYPDDVEATAFYGLAMLGTAHGGRDTAVYMRAAGLLEEAWTTHQEHPGLLHYLIHCYDDPAHAPLGLRAARLYSKIAPDAGHAQHMTAHIFLALGMWRETVEANINGIAAVDRMRHRTQPDCGHYQTWLSYAYLQLGEIDRARATVDGCAARAAAVPDAAPVLSMDPDNSKAGSAANMRLRYLIDTSDWSGAVAQMPLARQAGPGAKLDTAFADVLRAVGQRDRTAAAAALPGLEVAARDVIEVETKRADEDPTYRVRPEIVLLQARGLLAELTGDLAAAERQLKEAVAREEGLPTAFGPPTIDKPSNELLGEFYLRRGRLQDARAAFTRALSQTPGRRLAVQGLAAAESRR